MNWEKGRHLSAIFLGPASLLTDAMNWEKGRHLAAIFLGPASILTDAMNWEKGRHLAAICLFLAATHTVKNNACYKFENFTSDLECRHM